MRDSVIKRLIKMVEESQIEELEISRWGKRVRISKKARPVALPGNKATVVARSADSEQKADTGTVPTAEGEIPTKDQMAITSPMVGTFYRSPSPEAEAFVKVGQKIEKGQVVCIVEAMKLMNEIESKQSGRITEVLVEDTQPVEFGQKLFLLEPA
jgi:acetyl-CoA carboxylase biotin carboxyl carrier protein